MKLTAITNITVVLSDDIKQRKNFHILNIPIAVDGVSYIEGKDLSLDDFHRKMAISPILPKTNQLGLVRLDKVLLQLSSEGYTHVIGLFLSSRVSGFWQSIQFLVDDYPGLAVAFPDGKVTYAPLDSIVRNTLNRAETSMGFDDILAKLQQQVDEASAFIMVDDLNHLVKGERLSNGSALIGNLLNIRPILYFNDEGVIGVFRKVKAEKKAIKRSIGVLSGVTVSSDYEVFIIHSQTEEKAQQFYQTLTDRGQAENLKITTFDGIITTHLRGGTATSGFIPIA